MENDIEAMIELEDWVEPIVRTALAAEVLDLISEFGS
jgi:hypothetical protein